jgi:diguanylate cyclase (GGDEF)-like protein/PAS domain S-box-containing protein
LQTVAAQFANREAFLARVKYLYEHPDEKAHDELKLMDGRVIERHSAPLRDARQKYLGRIWYFRDITERERAAEALKQSETRFKAIFDNARDGIALVDFQSKTFSIVNDRLCAMLGYSLDKLTGLSIDDIHPADALPHINQEFERHARQVTRVLMDIPIKRKDGSVFFADINSATATIGGKQYVLGIFRDITERRLAEQATKDTLLRTQEQLQTVGQVGQSEALLSGDVEALARETTELAARASGCERVNVWLFNEAQTELRCIDLYEGTPARHSQGMVLREPDFFDEIQIIKTSKYVNADDPLTDPRTKGYVEAYIKPLRITSMLDVAIQASGRTFGLLCFEHVDKLHHWEPDEIAFAGQLADKIGLALISRLRRQAETALKQRDALLHATAIAATELVTAPTLDDAIPKALKMVGAALQIDRITVLDRPPTADAAPVLRFVWQASDIKVVLDKRFFENPALMTPQMVAWQSPLSKGRLVTADVRTATDDVKRMLESIGTKSLLVVPVSVDGKYWGELGFEGCKSERAWPAFEIEILQSLADLIGNAIQRDRYVKELADANRIVQNTPTILYRMRGEPSMPMIYVSQNVKLFGHEPGALIASPHLYQSLIHPDDLMAVRESQAHALEENSQRGVIEFRLLNSHGDYRWVENRYAPIRDTAGRLIEIEGLLIDITERKLAEEKIALLARTDPLTGLANRTTFIERLQQSFAAAQRGAMGFAVLYLDLDRFKDINDTLGHPVGDRFLMTVSERLKISIRESDLAARLGGDEFAVLQTELADSSDAGTLATKIRAAVAEPIQLDGNDVHATASIGISLYSADTQTPEDMLAQADVALYRAKEEGRDQYRFHTEELDVQVREQIAIAEELRMAVAGDQFELHYQPQVELSTGKIVGMEALIRWNHPTRGQLLPAAFIAVADRTGIGATIGHWVLEHACRQMSLWRQAGIAPATLAVNISPAQIRNGDEFLAFVTETLAKWQLPPESLELDVTESMLARATLAQSDVLERLQKFGINISIDDFGTKYSTLDYLKTYRVNRLKIPQALTDAATRDPDSAAMVRAIVGIARELNLEMIAQGVETEAQWLFLTATSPVSKVQGYYFSEPVPAERADDLLRRGRIALPANGRKVRAARKAPA